MVDMVNQAGGTVSVREDMVGRMLDAGFRVAPPKGERPKPARKRPARRASKR